MITKTSEYKGLNIFQIWEEEGDKFPKVSFGLDKAEAIVANIDKIKAYIADNGEAYREAQAKKQAERDAKRAEREAKKAEREAKKEQALLDYAKSKGLTLVSK